LYNSAEGADGFLSKGVGAGEGGTDCRLEVKIVRICIGVLVLTFQTKLAYSFSIRSND
jgi:hypothetical protein